MLYLCWVTTDSIFFHLSEKALWKHEPRRGHRPHPVHICGKNERWSWTAQVNRRVSWREFRRLCTLIVKTGQGILASRTFFRFFKHCRNILVYQNSRASVIKGAQYTMYVNVFRQVSACHTVIEHISESVNLSSVTSFCLTSLERGTPGHWQSAP